MTIAEMLIPIRGTCFRLNLRRLITCIGYRISPIDQGVGVANFAKFRANECIQNLTNNRGLPFAQKFIDKLPIA